MFPISSRKSEKHFEHSKFSPISQSMIRAQISRSFSRCYSTGFVLRHVQTAGSWAQKKLGLQLLGLGIIIGVVERCYNQFRRGSALDEAANISVPTNDHIFYRPQIEEIESAFKYPNSLRRNMFTRECTVVFLHGFGGMGKSSLSIDYAQSNRAYADSNFFWGQKGRYTGVIRIEAIDAATGKTSLPKIIEEMHKHTKNITENISPPPIAVPGSLENWFLKIKGGAELKFERRMKADKVVIPPLPSYFNNKDAARKKIAAAFTQAINILTSNDCRTKGGKWLLIFDNVDSPAVFKQFIEILFPNGDNTFKNVDILISGRFCGDVVFKISKTVCWTSIPVKILEKNEEKMFFKHLTTDIKGFTTPTQLDLDTIFACTLGYPYLVQCAATYCASLKSTASLVSRLKSKENIAAIFKVDPAINYKKTPEHIYRIYGEDIVQELNKEESADVLKMLHTLPLILGETHWDEKKLASALSATWGKDAINHWGPLIRHLIRHSIIEEVKGWWGVKTLHIHPFVSKLIADVTKAKWAGAVFGFGLFNPQTCEADAKKIAAHL